MNTNCTEAIYPYLFYFIFLENTCQNWIHQAFEECLIVRL